MERAVLRVERAVLRVERPVLRVKRAGLRVERAVLRVERAVPRVKRAGLRVKRAVPRVERPVLRVKRAGLRVERPVLRVKRAGLRVERAVLRVKWAVLRVKTRVLTRSLPAGPWIIPGQVISCLRAHNTPACGRRFCLISGAEACWVIPDWPLIGCCDYIVRQPSGAPDYNGEIKHANITLTIKCWSRVAQIRRGPQAGVFLSYLGKI